MRYLSSCGGIYISVSFLQCDASQASWQLLNLIENNKDTRIMFLGEGCALATEPLAALAGGLFNVSTVSNFLHFAARSLSKDLFYIFVVEDVLVKIPLYLTPPMHALLMQLSYGSSTPTLSNTKSYPNFFRTIPSEVQSNSARLAIMKKFGWKRVATLHEALAVFSLVCI